MSKQQLQAFSRLLREHDLTLVQGKNHALVKKNDQTVSSVAVSPSDVNAYRQAVRNLVRSGLLPESARRIRF